MSAATIRRSDPASARARLVAAPFSHVLGFADPSDGGTIVATHAGMLAAASGARLTFYHSSDVRCSSYDSPPEALVGDVRSAAERVARATLESVAQATGVPRNRRQVLVERTPLGPETLAGVARRLEADLVVMAPQERRALAYVLGRSLTQATIARLHDVVPILCARGVATPYRRILVPTGFTPRCRGAFRLAARIAALFASEVTVLHAIGSGEDEEAARAALARFLPRELTLLAPSLAVAHGEPWAAVVNAVVRTDSDLVVMSTGGRDSLSDTVLGSQAERVIRHAPCPVLVS